MKKEKLILEYPLSYASEHILWGMIGSPFGLAEWFSDGVTVEGDKYTFSWDNHDQTALLINRKEPKVIRFRWEEDEDIESYFEMKIVTQDLSGNVGLLVTEFVNPDNTEEKEDMKMLWDKHIEDLRRKVGV